MKLSEIKAILPTLETVAFQTPDGSFVPEHFHVTEVGSIQKHFIDCGGTIRKEQVVNFQLWNANDVGFNGSHFILVPKTTACLAADACGIPVEKQQVSLRELSTSGNESSCTPDRKSTRLNSSH